MDELVSSVEATVRMFDDETRYDINIIWNGVNVSTCYLKQCNRVDGRRTTRWDLYYMLYNVVTHENYRNMGFASMMMPVVKGIARIRNMPVCLSVGMWNTHALHMYTKAGFRYDEEWSRTECYLWYYPREDRDHA